MTFEKTYEPDRNNQIIIRLPAKFKANKRVRVIIEGIDDDKSTKLKSLEEAAKDPLFLSDILEVHNDFQYVDEMCQAYSL